MANFHEIVKNYLSNESGATAIEYALIAALIAVGIIVGASSVASSVDDMFSNVDSDMGQAFSTD